MCQHFALSSPPLEDVIHHVGHELYALCASTFPLDGDVILANIQICLPTLRSTSLRYLILKNQ